MENLLLKKILKKDYNNNNSMHPSVNIVQYPS